MNFLRNVFGGSSSDYFLWDFIGQKLLGSQWDTIARRKVMSIDVDSSLPIFSNTTPVFGEDEIPYIKEIINIVSSNNGVFSGGAILSALHSERVNDFDCYFDNYLDLGKSLFALRNTFTDKFQLITRMKFMLQSSYNDSFLMKNKITCVVRVSIFKRFEPVLHNIDLILCSEDKFDVIKNFDLSFCSIWWSTKIGVGAFHISDSLNKRGKLNSDYFQYLIDNNEFIVGRLKKYISKGYEINIDCDNQVSITQTTHPVLSDELQLIMSFRKIMFNLGIEHLKDVEIFKILDVQTMIEFVDVLDKYKNKHIRRGQFDSDYELLQQILSQTMSIVSFWISSVLSRDVFRLHTLFKEPSDIDFRILILLMKDVYGDRGMSPGFHWDPELGLSTDLIVRKRLEMRYPGRDIRFDTTQSKFDLSPENYAYIANEVVSDFFKLHKQKYTLENKRFILRIYNNIHLFTYLVTHLFKNDVEERDGLLNLFYGINNTKIMMLAELGIFDTECDVPTERYTISEAKLASIPFNEVLITYDNAVDFLKEEPDEYGTNIVFINLSGDTPTAYGGKSSDFLNVRYDNMFMPCLENVTSAPSLRQVEDKLYIRPAIDIFRSCISIDCWLFIRDQIINHNQRVFTFNNRKQTANVSSVLTIKARQDAEGNVTNIFDEPVNIISSIHCGDSIFYYETVGVVSIE